MAPGQPAGPAGRGGLPRGGGAGGPVRPGRKRPGAAEEADGGVLVIEEVTALPPRVQEALLRLLKAGRVPAGGPGQGPAAQAEGERHRAVRRGRRRRGGRRTPAPRPVLAAGAAWCCGCRRCASGSRTSARPRSGWATASWRPRASRSSCARTEDLRARPDGERRRAIELDARPRSRPCARTPGRATSASSRRPSSARCCCTGRLDASSRDRDPRRPLRPPRAARLALGEPSSERTPRAARPSRGCTGRGRAAPAAIEPVRARIQPKTSAGKNTARRWRLKSTSTWPSANSALDDQQRPPDRRAQEACGADGQRCSRRP